MVYDGRYNTVYEPPSAFSLLRTRQFLPLFLTQFLGAFNDNLFKSAFTALLTYSIAEKAGLNAQITVVVAAGLFILPFFLFSATAGQLAEKFEKSRQIRIIKLCEILLVAMGACGFYMESVGLLFAALFLLGAQSTFFGPLKYSILPDHLRQEDLVAGNGLIEAGTFLAILVGMILGNDLIMTESGVALISALMILISAGGFVSSFFIPHARPAAPNLHVSFNFLKETVAIMRYSARHREVFLAITGISWFWFVGATFIAQFPTYAKDVFHANHHVLNLFLASFSIGIGLGSVFCNKLLKGRIHATYVPLAALGMTGFIVDLYFTSGKSVEAMALAVISGELMGAGAFLSTLSHWRILGDLLMIAFCGGVFTVPLYALVQSRTEHSHLSRTIASLNVMNALFMVASAILTVLMLKLGMTVTQVFLTVAVLNAVVAIYICQLLPEALVKSLLQWVLKTCYRVQVRGLDHFDAAGDKAVIIANHTSFLDAALLAAFLPGKVMFAINTHIAKQWWVRPFLTMVEAFPMDPTNPMSTKALIEELKKGKRCVIFPEGRITVTGSLMKVYEGPGMIADKAGAKLLPVRIDGAQYTRFSRLKGKVRLRRFPDISLNILPARGFDIPADTKGRARRKLIGFKLYDIMTDLMFQSSDWKKTLFESLLDARAIHGGGHVIAEDIERRPFTYDQLIAGSFILGGRVARATERGEFVGVLLPNMVSTIVLFFGILAYGRVPAMLNYSIGSKNVLSACKTAQIKTVYTARRFVEMARLGEMVEALGKQGVHIVYLEDMRRRISFRDSLRGAFSLLAPYNYYRSLNFVPPPKVVQHHGHYSPFQHKKARKMALPGAELPAVVLFTSGSEGEPKGVVLSNANINANRYQLASRIDFGPTDIVFNALPVFHSFGLTGGTLLPLLSGIRTFFYPSPLHYRIVPELAYDANATIMFGTDTFLSGYAKFAHPYDFYSIRYIFSGAEKLKEETRRLWADRFGARIFEGYGATETAPALATNTPMQNKPGTVGRFLPGILYKLDNVEGIAEGGRLQVNGPNVMLGYLLSSNPGKIEPPEFGWYDTGDIVHVDQEGFISIKGRAKRFAKIGGEMVSLTAIEGYASEIWPGFQHAATTIPDWRKGEQVVLVTTCPDATREKFLEYAQEKGIGEISIPRNFKAVEKLPLLGSGKTDYPAVQKLAEEG